MKTTFQVIAIFLFLSFGNSHEVKATVIMIIVGPNFVVLAADSRVNYFDPNTGTTTIESTTKIFQSGKYYFSLSGVIQDPETGYYPAKIINEELKKNPDFNVAIEKIKIRIHEAAIKELKFLKDKKPQTFDFTVKNNQGSFIGVGIIGIINDKPMGYMFSYSISNVELLTIEQKKTYCPGPEYPNGFATMYGGTTGAIKDYMDNLKALGQTNQMPIDFINNAILKQAEATPATVGPPIDIIAINLNGGPVWIQQKKGCPVILD